jgi:hypothetical protein
MTNLALAIAIDPEFPALAKELVFMGGSLNPQTADPEFANTPRHEFNLWFDPEAAHIVLTAPWKKIVCTTVDISLKTKLTGEMLEQLRKSNAPAGRYVGTYTKLRGFDYLWDEMAALAWLDSSVITKTETRYMDVDLDRGAGYGNTLTWSDKDKPSVRLQRVEIQDEYDREQFYKIFVELLTSPTPHSSGAKAPTQCNFCIAGPKGLRHPKAEVTIPVPAITASSSAIRARSAGGAARGAVLTVVQRHSQSRGTMANPHDPEFD